MAVLHKIKAHLYDNALTDNPNDFVARVFSEKSLNIGDVCESAAKRGGADISAAAMRHAVELYLTEMAYNLCDGFAINAGWFTAQPVIRGTFSGPSDKFDAERHSVVFDFHQGALLRRELGTVDVHILGAAEAGAFIAQVVDVKTGSVNDQLTPNRNLKILGSKLRVIGEDEANGVYFVPQGGGERVKVDPSDIVKNDPSEIIVLTPALPAGAYTVEVVTQFCQGKVLLKEPRSAVFDKLLTAA